MIRHLSSLATATLLAFASDARAQGAANRALFQSTEPLAFTLIANYGAISKDRDTLSTKRFDGTVVVNDTAGVERRIPVRIRTRGHYRLMARNCRFVPLRIDFPDSGLKGTPFAGQKGLKLGTHCQNDGRYDDYTRREYLTYRLHNVLTERSFRARLVTATYVDSASEKKLDTRTGLFIENEDDVARRNDAKVRELRGAVFADVDPAELLFMTVFEYMIGNTDFSLYALHNVRIGLTTTGIAIPLIYDFDFSGLVNTHYSTPDPRMGIKTVRDRKFRGPCHTEAELQAVAKIFLSKKDSLYAEIAAVPGLSKRDQSDAKEYLNPFFSMLSDPRSIKSELIDGCEKRPGV